MILSLISTKGGTTKSTIVLTVGTSKAFQKHFKSVALVDFDEQGTITEWWESRQNLGLPKKHFDVFNVSDLSESETQNKLLSITESHDCVILDIPGQSTAGYETQIGCLLADIIILPTRSSTNDESAVFKHLVPIVHEILSNNPEKQGNFHVLPSFTHPLANLKTLGDYFKEILPDYIKYLNAPIPARSVFENFNRNGMTLYDYKKAVSSNKKLEEQANKGIADVERLAKAILNLS